jgi:1-aminocyclopropane-1-carboxylate deaminase
MNFSEKVISRLSVITDEITQHAGVSLSLLREDEIHPLVSGNKFRKLKYNVLQVQENKLKGIVTYGGPHSNHIAATAVACQLANIPCSGIIRKGFGNLTDTPTIDIALDVGMQIQWLDNDTFTKQKLRSEVDEHGFFHIPEGGANALGVLGCGEILHGIPKETEIIAVACGTGSTLAGMLQTSNDKQQLLGVNVLKAPGMMQQEIGKWTSNDNYQVLENYHFGGYAKANEELFTFIAWFYKQHGIMLDMVYTGKLMFALYQEMKSGKLTNKKMVAIHTGGLQGNKGMEKRYGVSLFK